MRKAYFLKIMFGGTLILTGILLFLGVGRSDNENIQVNRQEEASAPAPKKEKKPETSIRSENDLELVLKEAEPFFKTE